eukprot:GEMP01035282.1.p1 GENE.GEMP01035282.1~~GEMP01035282.1.p1  ORF type:complete len:287 (+),score=72.92 GEMP01035282.1:112-972(+)
MVLLHIKKQEKKNEFLVETTVKILCQDLLVQLVTLHNLRLKVLRLARCIRELAKHGPIRPEETRGLSDETSKCTPLDVNAYGKPSNPDEYGYRTGCPPPAEVAAVLERTASEAESAVSHTLVDQRRCITTKICQEMLDNMRGAVMIAYPAYHRLPVYDPARQELEDKEELDGHTENQDVFEVEGCSLWFAGKEVQTTKFLEEFVGKNEKTKVCLKMQARSAGAPVREPRIDQETHKSMLAFYYKKQEEQKKLQEDDDDSYLDSAWANSKALKSQLVGGGRPIHWKG